jgi:hypothetical protein
VSEKLRQLKENNPDLNLLYSSREENNEEKAISIEQDIANNHT